MDHPRLTLPDDQRFDRARVPGLIKQLYADIISAFEHFPSEPVDRILQIAIGTWHSDRQDDFMLLLERWSQNRYEPPEIWILEEDGTRFWLSGSAARSIRYSEGRQLRLKPLLAAPISDYGPLPLQVDEFGSGDSFLDIFEHGDSGVSSAEREKLLDLMDERDRALGVLKD